MAQLFAGRLTTAQFAREFMLAGKARVTFVSERTGTRFTYRIAAKLVQANKQPTGPWFVALLNGQDNTRDFAFLGTIFDDRTYRHGGKSVIAADAASAKGFAWVWDRLARDEMPAGVEIWHSGTCGRCSRDLTVPESIARGLGPICADL